MPRYRFPSCVFPAVLFTWRDNVFSSDPANFHRLKFFSLCRDETSKEQHVHTSCHDMRRSELFVEIKFTKKKMKRGRKKRVFFIPSKNT